MHTGYLIVGTLWVACNAAFLAAGFTENVAATMIAGLITALAATVLLVPIIFVAGGLWGLWCLMAAARIRRKLRHVSRRAR